MGYTHYWEAKGKVNAKAYQDALKDIAAIVTHSKNILANGSGEAGTAPVVKGAIGIEFNGQDDGAHETFFLPKSADQLEEFAFCKTAQKEYDVVVVAALSRLAEVSGMTVSSDGDAIEWKEGVALASRVLKRPVANPRLTPEEQAALPPPQPEPTPRAQPKKKTKNESVTSSFHDLLGIEPAQGEQPQAKVRQPKAKVKAVRPKQPKETPVKAKKKKAKKHGAWKIAKNPKKLAELKMAYKNRKKNETTVAEIAKKFGMSVSNLYYTLTTGKNAKKVRAAEIRKGKIVYNPKKKAA